MLACKPFRFLDFLYLFARAFGIPFVEKGMSADIEKGLVKTVIVKDLSRFGRNYIEVGSYSEIIYPEAGVRFIYNIMP